MDDRNDLAALLAHSRAPQVMQGATAELAAGIYQRYWLTNLADRLEKSFGPTLLAREELLAWLAEQIERIGTSGITDCGLASTLIDEAYQEWLKVGSARFFERHVQ